MPTVNTGVNEEQREPSPQLRAVPLEDTTRPCTVPYCVCNPYNPYHWRQPIAPQQPWMSGPPQYHPQAWSPYFRPPLPPQSYYPSAQPIAYPIPHRWTFPAATPRPNFYYRPRAAPAYYSTGAYGSYQPTHVRTQSGGSYPLPEFRAKAPVYNHSPQYENHSSECPDQNYNEPEAQRARNPRPIARTGTTQPNTTGPMHPTHGGNTPSTTRYPASTAKHQARNDDHIQPRTSPPTAAETHASRDQVPAATPHKHHRTTTSITSRPSTPPSFTNHHPQRETETPTTSTKKQAELKPESKSVTESESRHPTASDPPSPCSSPIPSVEALSKKRITRTSYTYSRHADGVLRAVTHVARDDDEARTEAGKKDKESLTPPTSSKGPSSSSTIASTLFISKVVHDSRDVEVTAEEKTTSTKSARELQKKLILPSNDDARSPSARASARSPSRTRSNISSRSKDSGSGSGSDGSSGHRARVKVYRIVDKSSESDRTVESKAGPSRSRPVVERTRSDHSRHDRSRSRYRAPLPSRAKPSARERSPSRATRTKTRTRDASRAPSHVSSRSNVSSRSHVSNSSKVSCSSSKGRRVRVVNYRIRDGAAELIRSVV